MTIFHTTKNATKNVAIFYQYFRPPIENYGNNCKCVLDETHKRLYSFLCPSCKMVSFLNFELAANDACIIYLKRQQFVIKLCQQIKPERTRWKERTRQQQCIRQTNF